MRLNAVDLPAPLGPIIATIEPGSIAKSSSLTATSPPKRWVTRSSVSSGTSAHRLGVERLFLTGDGFVALGGVQLGLALAARDQTFGPEQHHHHQDHAVDHEA